MKKFDIFNADLNPKKGHAQAGIRPVIIIQNSELNKYSPTTIIIPLTSKIIKCFPGEFLITPSLKNGLKLNSRVLMSHIIVLDKKFLKEKLGSLEEKYKEEFQKNLTLVLDLENIF